MWQLEFSEPGPELHPEPLLLQVPEGQLSVWGPLQRLPAGGGLWGKGLLLYFHSLGQLCPEQLLGVLFL